MQGNQGRELQNVQQGAKQVGFQALMPRVAMAYQSEDMHLRDYLQILRKRKWSFIGTFVLCVAFVVTITLLMNPVYRASVLIKIDKENPNVLDMSGQLAMGNLGQLMGEDYYQTQYKVLKSRALAKKIIYENKLEQHPEFAEARQEAQERIAKTGANPVGDSVRSNNPHDTVSNEVIEAFLKKVNVDPIQKSRLVKVSFDSHEPQFSAVIADSIAKSFIQFNVEKKFEATSQSKQWLESQEKEMRAKVAAAEENLNNYVAKHGIVIITEEKSGNDRLGRGSSATGTVVTSQLAQLSTNLIQAASERIGKEAIYWDLKAKGGDANSIILANPLIQQQKKDVAAMEADYAQLAKLYRDDHPRMVRLKEQIDALKSRLSLEVRKTATAIKGDYDAAVRREKTLAAAMDKQKAEAMAQNKKMVQYEILKRELETSRALHEVVLTKTKETDIATSLTSSNIQVLDIAETPVKQHRPSWPINGTIAVMLGFFGGLGLVFLREYLDNTVKAPADLEKRVGLPSLGIIPNFNALSQKPETALIVHENKKGPLSEAYRSIGTYIRFSSADKAPRMILITSAREGEGKTTTSVNSAISMVHTSGRGVLIDADMRKPQLHRIFGLPNTKGLSSYLAGHVEMSDAGLIMATKVENLDVILAGVIPPNPSELLGSLRMRELLHALLRTYAFVVVDAPPVLGLSDAIILSTMAEGVIMVLRAAATPKDEALSARKLLEGVNAKILGVVLNGVNARDLKYGTYAYYSSYYYEGKSYGGRTQKARKFWGRAA